MLPIIELNDIKYFRHPSGRTSRAATINGVRLYARDFPLSNDDDDGRPREYGDFEFIMKLKEQSK